MLICTKVAESDLNNNTLYIIYYIKILAINENLSIF